MRLIKLSEVMNMTALSRATIYRKMEAGEFPQRINLGVVRPENSRHSSGH